MAALDTPLPDSTPVAGKPPEPKSFFSDRLLIIVLVVGVAAVSVSTILLYPLLSRLSDQSGTTDRAETGTSPESGPGPVLTPTAVPTPIQLRHGKEIYSVSQSVHTGPEINQVVFDPLDVNKGETLTVEVNTSDTVPVDSVAAILQTDHGKQPFSLTRTATNGDKSTWRGTVSPAETLWYTYILTVTAQSANGSNVVIVAPRS